LLPRSPIKIFAGGRLKYKKPQSEMASPSAIIETVVLPSTRVNKAIAIAKKSASTTANPSIPSMKL
jgi:hypothetical protein